MDKSNNILQKKLSTLTYGKHNDLLDDAELESAINKYSKIILENGANNGSQGSDSETSHSLDVGDDDTPISFKVLNLDTRSQVEASIQTQLEREDIRLRSELMQQFLPLSEDLDELDHTVQSLAITCDQIVERLQRAREATEALAVETARLSDKRQLAEKRLKVINHFQSRYSIPQSDLDLIASPDTRINSAFFDTLSRVCEVHDDCAIMACLHHQRFGLEMLRSLRKNLDDGFSKLQRWILDELGLFSAGSEHVSSYFPLAFRALRRVPTYFVHCCDELVARRYSVLARRFLLAAQEVAEGSPAASVAESIGKAIAAEFRRLGINPKSDKTSGRPRKDSSDYSESESGSESESSFERSVLYRDASPSSSSSSFKSTSSTLSMTQSMNTTSSTTQRVQVEDDIQIGVEVAREELCATLKMPPSSSTYKSAHAVRSDLLHKLLEEMNTGTHDTSGDPISVALASILSIVHEAVAVESKFLSHIFIDPIEDPSSNRVLKSMFAAIGNVSQSLQQNPSLEGARLFGALTGKQVPLSSLQSADNSMSWIKSESDSPLNTPPGLLVRILSAVCRPLRSRVYGAASLAVLAKKPIGKLQNMRASASVFSLVVARSLAYLSLSLDEGFDFAKHSCINSDYTAEKKAFVYADRNAENSSVSSIDVPDESLLRFWKLKPDEGTPMLRELRELLYSCGFVRAVRSTLVVLERALSFSSDRCLVNAMQSIKAPTIRAFAVSMPLGVPGCRTGSDSPFYQTKEQSIAKSQAQFDLNSDFSKGTNDAVVSAAIAAVEASPASLIADGIDCSAFKSDPCASSPSLTGCLEELRVLLKTLQDLPIEPDPFDVESSGELLEEDRTSIILETITRWTAPIEQAIVRACNRLQPLGVLSTNPTGKIVTTQSTRASAESLQKAVLSLYCFNIHADIEAVQLPYSQTSARKKEAGVRLKIFLQEVSRQQAVSTLRSTGFMAKMLVLEAWKIRVDEIALNNSEATTSGSTSTLRPIPLLSREPGMSASELRVATTSLLNSLGLISQATPKAGLKPTQLLGNETFALHEYTANPSAASEAITKIVEKTKNYSHFIDSSTHSGDDLKMHSIQAPGTVSEADSTALAAAAAAAARTASSISISDLSDMELILQSGDLAAIWMCDRVSNTALRRMCKKDARKHLLDTYREFYNTARTAEAGYGRAEFETIFPITPDAADASL